LSATFRPEDTAFDFDPEDLAERLAEGEEGLPMTPHQTLDATSETAQELSAVVRAGCFTSEDEAIREAVQMLFAVKPQLRLEAAIRRYLDREITFGRAAALAGVTRWRLCELLAPRGLPDEIEARPARELDEAVARLRQRRS
jgi:predicted HTH domain antitoxin